MCVGSVLLPFAPLFARAYTNSHKRSPKWTAPCILFFFLYAEEKEKENYLQCFSNDHWALLLAARLNNCTVVILDVTLSMQIASIKCLISRDIDRLHVWIVFSLFILQKKAIANDLYEQVFYTLDLIEKDYFGLQFTDNNNVKHWLDPTKTIKKQIKIGPPFTLHLKVKFYSSEPNTLREELTRYQFFLQLKQDIITGRLEVPDPTIYELCALSLQCE